MNIVDINKKYRTRDGRNVEILKTNIPNFTHEYTVVGIIEGEAGVDYWREDGRDGTSYGDFSIQSPTDLIEKLNTTHVRRWIRFYKYPTSDAIFTDTTSYDPTSLDEVGKINQEGPQTLAIHYHEWEIPLPLGAKK